MWDIRGVSSVALPLYRPTDGGEESYSDPFFNATLPNGSGSKLEVANNKDDETMSSSRGNFGDIMSPTSDDANLLFRDGLVTSETYSLAKVYGIHHPLDRMAVTANGNLQRLFSSYYYAPVHVLYDYCCSSIIGDWDTLVHLTGVDHSFCVADSKLQ